MTTTQPEPELLDEQILERTQQIKDEEAQKVPLVCQEEPMSKLEEEFKNNEPFLRKVKNLEKNGCNKFRKCRGDGNCFFRAFAFAWFESVHDNPETYETALIQLESTPDLLDRGGFQKLAYEDFYDVTLEQFKRLSSHVPDKDMMLVNFQSDEISNAIVMHFRFVASAFLKIHAAEYEPFLTDEAVSIDLFCSKHVEVLGVESDHLQIIALSKAFNTHVYVYYLDGNETDHVSVHKFPEEQDNKTATTLQLIYRPGHYDILYGTYTK